MSRWMGGMLALVCVTAYGQTHAVKRPDSVVRAVAVYEWMGELAKPAASRLVPVSVFIDNTLEDAGIYLARPIPFALDTGTVFELEKAGMDKGTLELAFARHLETADDAPGVRADNGWFGYGSYKPEPSAPVIAAKKKSGPLPVVVASGGTRPHFSNKADDPSATPTDRSGAAGAGTTVSASAPPPTRPVDNDGPTLKRPAATTDTDSDSDSAKDNPDRPTLKKRTPQEQKTADKKRQTASVVGTGDLNDDPDRPTLHRGKPAGALGEDDLPALHGIPPGMHQMVAVSDAENRPEHDFARPWESPDERVHVLAEMRSLAVAKMTGYRPAVAPVAAPAAKQSAPMTPAAKRRAARAAAVAAKAPAVSPTPVFDPKSEELKGYTLSYGGAATYVYTAETPDAKDPVLVTVVAQREPDGSLKTALASVTDADHLDRTPQLRLVDAVDPDASNRASLLFERRGQTVRDFALYRVIGAHAEQAIASGAGY